MAAATILTASSIAATARADAIDEGPRFRSVALQGDVAGIFVGRYSASLEYLPAPHHALHVSPVAYYALPGVSDQFDGFGGEAGYRWYSGIDGPEGAFAGASFLLGEYHYLHTTSQPTALDMPDDTAFLSIGGAIDVGWQAIVLGDFAVGVGGGVQWTKDYDPPHFEFSHHPWHDILYGDGFRPRAFVLVGTAF